MAIEYRTHFERLLIAELTANGIELKPASFHKSLVDSSIFQEKENTIKPLLPRPEEDNHVLRSTSAEAEKIKINYDFGIRAKKKDLAGKTHEELEQLIADALGGNKRFFETATIKSPVQRFSKTHQRNYTSNETIYDITAYDAKSTYDSAESSSNMYNPERMVKKILGAINMIKQSKGVIN